METNFKISSYFKTRSGLILVLSIVLIVISVWLVLIAVRISTERTEDLQKRVIQLEEMVKQLTGGVPLEGLHSVSGLVLFQENSAGKESIVLKVNVADIDVNSETLDFSLLYPPRGKELLEVEVTPETEILLIMPSSEESGEVLPLPMNHEQFKMGISPPYALLVQTVSENPGQQKRIQAFSITIYTGLKFPEPESGSY